MSGQSNAVYYYLYSAFSSGIQYVTGCLIWLFPAWLQLALINELLKSCINLYIYIQNKYTYVQ